MAVVNDTRTSDSAESNTMLRRSTKLVAHIHGRQYKIELFDKLVLDDGLAHVVVAYICEGVLKMWSALFDEIKPDNNKAGELILVHNAMPTVVITGLPQDYAA